jgi:hypothetical protein
MRLQIDVPPVTRSSHQSGSGNAGVFIEFSLFTNEWVGVVCPFARSSILTLPREQAIVFRFFRQAVENLQGARVGALLLQQQEV